MSDFTSDQPGHSALASTKHIERSFEENTPQQTRSEQSEGRGCDVGRLGIMPRAHQMQAQPRAIRETIAASDGCHAGQGLSHRPPPIWWVEYHSTSLTIPVVLPLRFFTTLDF